MEQRHLHHLYNRAAFGISPEDFIRLRNTPQDIVVRDLFSASKTYNPLHIPTPKINSLVDEMLKTRKLKRLPVLIKKSRMKQIELNHEWFMKMTSTKTILRERMVLFWTNHFVCRDNNILFIQQYNNTLRKHALGNFRDFLIAVSKEPAMLNYLNNQQNRKWSPNENFARELMELFTLGQGNYTENDVKEAARAFTGWRHNAKGEFKFAKRQHDIGQKTFFGKTGYFVGEDIIDMILAHPACARFICTKLYRYFVNEHVNEVHVKELSEVFRKRYEIEEVLNYMFTIEWFYDGKNIGSKIKSPLDFLVGIARVVPYSFNNPKQLIYVQKLLGQILFLPPNVAGWPGGKNWIDANTLMTRLMLPSVLLNNGSIAFDVKGEFEDKAEQFEKNKNFNRKLSINKNWDTFQKHFRAFSKEELVLFLIGNSLNEETRQFLNSLEDESKKNFCVQLMSLPEYQLC
ncbi:DUF1800 domain-containing protein [Spongiivirga sp. MCCC 1A20706]|uniref:DUF1800 domain-containing protein n=1 Tax=Spongiivirga sp. MCCC 1A20706 TaxID=3160963 RepID=UPI003977B66E